MAEQNGGAAVDWPSPHCSCARRVYRFTDIGDANRRNPLSICTRNPVWSDPAPLTDLVDTWKHSQSVSDRISKLAAELLCTVAQPSWSNHGWVIIFFFLFELYYIKYNIFVIEMCFGWYMAISIMKSPQLYIKTTHINTNCILTKAVVQRSS